MRVCLMCLLSLAMSAPALADEPAFTLEEGFVPLFNGRDLTGWRHVGQPGAFHVRDGLLETAPEGRYPAWLRTDRTYENFILRFDFMLPHYNESNLLIHAPIHGNAVNAGIAFKLCDDSAHGSKALHCGSIVGVEPARMVATGKYNRWYPVEVRMEWPTLRVTVNNQVVQDIDCAKHAELRHRLRSGYIGLQHNNRKTVWRSIRIKELPSTETWTPLFNGQDFTGWDRIEQAKWEVADGVIRVRGGGYLVTREQYRDFELFMFVRTHDFANGGVFFRWKARSPNAERGNEIQLFNMPDCTNPTGSIYAVQRADRCPARDGEWFPLQIIVRDRTALVRVDGVTVATTDALELTRPGSIALQSHSSSLIEFKDIRIKPLP